MMSNREPMPAAGGAIPPEEMRRRIKQAVEQHAPGATVLLYGSRARGDAGPDSDWDILIIVPDDEVAAGEQAQDAIYDIAIETGEVLSVFVVGRSRWQAPITRASLFFSEVSRDAVSV